MRIGLGTTVLLAISFIIFTRTEAAGAPLEADRLSIGGEIRERYEFRDNADFDRQTGDALSFVGSRIRLHMGYEIEPDVQFFLQMQDSRVLGFEAATASNEKNLDLHQGYLTVKNLAGPLTLTLGRQELAFGDHRLVGNFGWSNIGRSFDGLRLNYALGALRLDGWAMVPRQYENAAAADPDLTKPSRDSQQFHGLYAAVRTGAFVVEPYVLYLLDTGNVNELDPATGKLVSPVTAPAARGQNRITTGLRLDGKILEEALDFTGEAAWQTGGIEARTAASPTPRSDIRAYAYAVKAGFTWPAAIKPRIGIEYDFASGDDDPGDAEFGTFENLFPTNHPHYGNMDYVGWRNMRDLRFSLGMKPTKTSGVSLDYHRFGLAEKADHWYAASGKVFRTTPPANSDTDLGQELNVVIYGMVRERLRMESGYGRFIPGEYVKRNFPSADDPSDFFYIQMSAGF